MTATVSALPITTLSDLENYQQQPTAVGGRMFLDQIANLDLFQSDLPDEWRQHFSQSDLPHDYKNPLDLIEDEQLVATGWNFRDIVPEGDDKRSGRSATTIALDPKTGDFYILSVSQTNYRDEPTGHETQWHMAFVLKTDIYGAYSHVTKAATGTGIFDTEPQEAVIGDTPSFWMTSQTRDETGNIITDLHQLRWENRPMPEGPAILVFDLQNDGALTRAVWPGSDADSYGHIAQEKDGRYLYHYTVDEGGLRMPAQSAERNAWPLDVQSFMDHYFTRRNVVGNTPLPVPGQP